MHNHLPANKIISQTRFLQSFVYLLVLCCLNACVYDAERFYTEKEIHRLSIIKHEEDHFTITFSPRLSTFYHCPGANIEKKYGALIVRFVRCPIQANCSVDVPTIQDKQTPSIDHIQLPYTTRPIYIEYGNKAIKIWPTDTLNALRLSDIKR